MIELTPPNGCRHCGIVQAEHMNLWTKEAGWHTWTEPSDRTRKERMIARRALRTGTQWRRWGRTS